MSDDGFSWGDLLDLIVFHDNAVLRREIPPIEAKDGQEPTAESLREQARQADAKRGKPRKLSTEDPKSLDKEFWETM